MRGGRAGAGEGKEKEKGGAGVGEGKGKEKGGGGVPGLDTLGQRGLDGDDAFIGEARHLEVGPHLRV